MARKRPELKAAAAELRRKFNRDFWMARERFVAQGLDGAKRQVEVLTSNPGHCLWTGILPPARARAVASRLVSPELFTGWGIRTLSSRAVNYDPCSYHNGSVWPHDCAIAAAGLRRYGLARERAGRAVDLKPGAFPAGACQSRRHEPSAGAPRRLSQQLQPQNWAAASPSPGHNSIGTQGREARPPADRSDRDSLWRRVEVTGLHPPATGSTSRLRSAGQGRQVAKGNQSRNGISRASAQDGPTPNIRPLG
jgi:hypothetical protein